MYDRSPCEARVASTPLQRLGTAYRSILGQGVVGVVDEKSVEGRRSLLGGFQIVQEQATQIEPAHSGRITLRVAPNQAAIEPSGAPVSAPPRRGLGATQELIRTDVA